MMSGICPGLLCDNDALIRNVRMIWREGVRVFICPMCGHEELA